MTNAQAATPAPILYLARPIQDVRDFSLGTVPDYSVESVTDYSLAPESGPVWLTASQVDFLGDLADALETVDALRAKLAFLLQTGEKTGGKELEAERESARAGVRWMTDLLVQIGAAL